MSQITTTEISQNLRVTGTREVSGAVRLYASYTITTNATYVTISGNIYAQYKNSGYNPRTSFDITGISLKIGTQSIVSGKTKSLNVVNTYSDWTSSASITSFTHTINRPASESDYKTTATLTGKVELTVWSTSDTSKVAYGTQIVSGSGEITVPHRHGYTIGYHPNGGNGTATTYTKYAGETHSVKSNLGFSRVGYAFSSWNTHSSGTGTKYSPGANYSADADVTLYAQWAANSYTVTLNKNSGSGGLDSVSVRYDAAMPKITVPTKSGWTFQGYYDTSAATGGTQYYTSSGASARSWNKTSNTTLYARWSRTITFIHGKSKASSSTATQYYGGNVTPPSITAISGWTAKGWREDTGTSGPIYGTGSFAYTSSTTTLYAIYSRTLKLSYTNGGGSGTAPAQQESTQYYNTNGGVSSALFTLQSNTFTAPSDQGGGWAFSKWGAGTAGAKWYWSPTVDASTTTSTAAVWTRTVTFKSGINSATSKTATQTHGSAVSVPSGTVTPSGWSHLGWRTDTTASTANYSGSSISPSVTTVYAVFSRTLTLTYTGGGGTGTAPSNTTATQYYNSYGNKSTASFTLRANTFTRAGYYFSKWGAGNANATWSWSPTVDAGASTSTAAQWTSYYITLRYNVNGGSVSTGTAAERWRASNGRLQRSTDSGATWSDVTHNIYTYSVAGDSTTNMWNVGTPPIVKSGYYVNGTEAWNTKTDGTGIALNQDYSTSSTDNAVTAYRLNGNKDLTANITVDVYPKWVANTYTVTLHRSNGTGGTDSVTATYDAAMPKINIPTRTGYDFSGYYDATSGGTQYYTSLGTSARSWNKTANTTLYAHWTEKTAVLTYDKSELSSADVPSAITMKYTTETTLTKGTAPSGYVFYGWATSDTRAKAGNKDYEGTAVYKKANVVPTNATLYAMWYSRVSYSANGHGTAPSTTNAFYNSKVVAAAGLSVNGYTFNGWNTKADGTGTNFTAGSSVVKAANTYKPDISLYAKWTANQYTITLNKNNGSGGSTSVTATYDAAMPSATMPTRPGYVFQGYYDAASGGTQYYTSAGASARNWNKASNTTLYAQWAATAPFTSGDYTFTVIDTGKVQAQATDKSKTTYEPIPVTVTDPVTHTSLQVTSIDNCFAGCDNLQGDIFVSHPIGQLESYTNVFTTTKPIYILATNSSPSHSIWQSIANSKSNITYLSADGYYSYVVNPSTHKYSIQTLSKTLTSYGNPKATLTSTTTWTADSMVGCFEGCEKLANAPVLPNTITNMSNCFKGCKALGSAPTIPNTVTNMDSCFYGCTNLISASTIPANVNTMVNCFYGCSGLRGNIIVKNSTVTSTNMFSNAGSTQNQIYIINGSNGDSTIANTWSSIANNYTNVHYEINDLNLSNATFSVTRQIYTNDSTNSISGYVGGYIKSNFNLNFTNIKGLPVGWTVNWSSTKPVEKMGNETFKTAITTQSDSNKLFFTHVENFLLNNNDITLTNYYTITTTDNRTFNKNHTYTAILADKNKQIINADYKDSDYIYTIIDTESTPKKVAAYAFNRTKQGYTTIPSTITINGTNYTVTSLYLPAYNSNGTLSTSTYVGGCFEGCINLTTAPTIPSTITDIRNCFKNCNNLTGNVVVNGNPSNYTNMFTGTSKPIYIVNGGVSTVPNFWKNNIVNQYSNVYFEGDNNAKPIIVSIIVSRGNYYNINTDSQDDAVMIWEEDDTDVWIRLDIGVQLQKTYLPTGWTNELIKSITVIFDDNPSIPGDNFFVEGEVLYRKTQSKTLKTQEQYYTRSGDTYTLVSNPTQTALNNGDYYIKGYNPDRIIIYFKAVKQVDGYEEEINYQTNVKVGITDFYKHEGTESAIVYAIFAMLDFLPGGHGMAIGQPSFKEGLEIGLPVLIGEELIPPYESDTYIPVRGHMAQAGKTYYKFVNNNYIQVTNPNDNTGFAEFEEYYEKVTAVDLNNRQLIVGKYNISNASTKDAFLVIGNGTKAQRSNLLVADSSGINITGNLQVNTINGHALSTAKDNNSIAVRTANGYLYASYLNQSSAAETPTTSSYIMYANSDGFLRKSTLANIKTILGLGSNAYSSVDYLPLTGGTVTGYTSFTNSVSITDLNAGQLVVNGNISAVNGINNFLIRIPASTTDADAVKDYNGIWVSPAPITNAPITNHGVLLGFRNVGTPFQFYIADSTHQYIYKRSWDNTNSVWRDWAKLSAGYADSAGSSTNATNANFLTHKTLDSTTINNTAGSFAFSGSGEPWAGTDWVGLQIGDSVDKFQLTVNAGNLLVRQNDSGGTNTSWTNWSTLYSTSNKPTAADVGALSLSGGTLTGSFNLKYSSVDASKTNNNISSTIYPTTFSVLDTSNRILARQEALIYTDGRIGSYWYIRNYNTDGTQVAQKGIQMIMAKDGTLTYSVSDPAKFTTAISALPLAGGTMSGSIIMNNETSISGKIARKKADGGGWAYSPFRFTGNDNAMFAQIGALGNANALTYMFIGSNAYNEYNLRVYSDGSTWTPTLTIQKETVGTNTYADANPKILFKNGNDSQSISLTYTDYDSIQAPASLTLNGNQGGEYFIAPNVKATTGVSAPTISAGALTTITSGRIWAGVDGNTSQENQLGARGGAGTIYMYSQASTSGGRGIYLSAHGTGSAKSVFSVDTNNNTTFYGTLSGNASTASSTPVATRLAAFSSASTSMTWGNQTGTVLGCYATTAGGGMGFRDNNPASGQVSMTIDGTVYIKEGAVNVGDAIKSITRSGTTFTYTTLWGNTGTFTQQDNNTVTTVTTTGTGNAVTAITASNGALTVTKGSTFSLSTHTHSYVAKSGDTMSGALTVQSTITTTSNIRLPNNVSLQGAATGSGSGSGTTTYHALIYATSNNNINIGSEDWNDCYLHCVYSPNGGTVSTAPNVRILDSHRLTRTTHANSSRKFKHNIKDIVNAELNPHNLYNIEVKQFEYNDDIITDSSDCRYHKELSGFIAEQVYEHYPIAVDVNEKGECEAWSPQYIVPPMLALIQEQHAEIEQLKKDIAELKNK